eukprot:c54126_g1_i1 orf=121-378(-)
MVGHWIFQKILKHQICKLLVGTVVIVHLYELCDAFETKMLILLYGCQPEIGYLKQLNFMYHLLPYCRDGLEQSTLYAVHIDCDGC